MQILIICWGFALILISFMYLLVCVDGNKKGCLASCKRFVFRKIPAYLESKGDNCCLRGGKWVVKIFCYRRNPIIQVLYFVLAVGGFYIYVRDAFPHAGGPWLPTWHRYTGTLLIFCCYYSYFKACTVDPGKLRTKDQANKGVKLFEYDEVLFFEGYQCKTCKIPKPARSKHCVVCNVCQEKFDHHCVWINNCVGLRNYKWFLTFLILHCMLTCYGWMAAIPIVSQMFKNGALRSGRRRFTFEMVLNRLIITYPIWTGIVVLCFVVSIMTFGFWAFHIYLVWKGLTTNEKIKRSVLVKEVQYTLKFFTKWHEANKKEKPFEITEHEKEDFEVTGNEDAQFV